MSMAWEVTPDDVDIVLDAHSIKTTDDKLDEILDLVNCDEIEDGVLYYTDMDDQTSASLSMIEDQLMEQNVIPPGEKKFTMPEDEDEDE